MNHKFHREKRSKAFLCQVMRTHLERVEDPALKRIVFNDLVFSRKEHLITIFVYIPSGERYEEVLSKLNKLIYIFRKDIGVRFKLFRTPNLVFVKDEAFSEGMEVTKALEE